MTARDLERKQLVQTIALIQKEQEIIKKQQEVAADTLQTQLKEVADKLYFLLRQNKDAPKEVLPLKRQA